MGEAHHHSTQTPMATKPEDDNALKKYKKAIFKELQSHYDNLSSVLEGCMPEFAKKAYAADLISEPVMKSRNFDSIISQFRAKLKLKHNISEIKQHCTRFIDILEEIGGPAVDAAKELSLRWSAAKLFTPNLRSGM